MRSVSDTVRLEPSGLRNYQRRVLLRLDLRSSPMMSKVSSPVMPSVAAESSPLKLQRQHAHADQVAAVDALRSCAR